MNTEERLISSFYSGLQGRDWKAMVQLYHADIFFYDPVFGPLHGPEPGAMWEMLLSGAKELAFEFRDVRAEEDYGSCTWTAAYVFPATGRRVVNKGKAMFRFAEGKIVEHQDEFSFWTWSSQALGWTGKLFGWTTLLQKGVRRRVRARLERFMKK
ncbi:MAG TPA: nuclear transport factor 2 family protein [Puia sp.]|nr:nuclear transport factor 2 family protein [Puia sp.]